MHRTTHIFSILHGFSLQYRGAGKSLARPGRKHARKHVTDARDFNNIETRAVTKFFFSVRQGAEGNSRHSDRNISLFPSWLGWGLISTPVAVRNKSHDEKLSSYFHPSTVKHTLHNTIDCIYRAVCKYCISFSNIIFLSETILLSLNLQSNECAIIH